jgi:hypothetical protein
VLDLTLPPSRPSGWKVVREWLAATMLVPLAVLALVGAGASLVLVLRLIAGAVRWLVSRIG